MNPFQRHEVSPAQVPVPCGDKKRLLSAEARPNSSLLCCLLPMLQHFRTDPRTSWSGVFPVSFHNVGYLISPTKTYIPSKRSFGEVRTLRDTGG